MPLPRGIRRRAASVPVPVLADERDGAAVRAPRAHRPEPPGGRIGELQRQIGLRTHAAGRLPARRPAWHLVPVRPRQAPLRLLLLPLHLSVLVRLGLLLLLLLLLLVLLQDLLVLRPGRPEPLQRVPRPDHGQGVMSGGAITMVPGGFDRADRDPFLLLGEDRRVPVVLLVLRGLLLGEVEADALRRLVAVVTRVVEFVGILDRQRLGPCHGRAEAGRERRGTPGVHVLASSRSLVDGVDDGLVVLLLLQPIVAPLCQTGIRARVGEAENLEQVLAPFPVGELRALQGYLVEPARRARELLGRRSVAASAAVPCDDHFV